MREIKGYSSKNTIRRTRICICASKAKKKTK